MKTRASALLLVLLFCPPAPAAAADADAIFARGATAFNAGNYTLALNYFRQAQAAGADGPALHHNLGSSLYRLGRYAEAQTAFHQAARSPEWAPLAYYNIGLAAHQAGDASAARDWFQRAWTSANDDKLRALAFTMLDRLDAAPRWRGVLSLNAGHDSNVALTTDSETLRTTTDSDTFVELLAAASYRFGAPGDDLRLDASLNSLRYTDMHEFDLTGLLFGATRLLTVKQQQLGFGGDLEYLWLDGSGFQRVLSLRAEQLPGLPNGAQARFAYAISRIDEVDPNYAFLAGWRYRVDASATQRHRAGRLRYGAALEVNQRADLLSGGEFFSHSPTRIALALAGSWPLHGAWRVEPGLTWRASRYADPDRRADGTVMTREDRLGEISVGVTRPLTADWRLAGIYRYTDNRSNFSEFDYTRRVVTISFARGF